MKSMQCEEQNAKIQYESNSRSRGENRERKERQHIEEIMAENLPELEEDEHSDGKGTLGYEQDTKK